MEQQSHHLDGLADLTAMAFGSYSEATANILDLIHRVLGVTTPFIAQTNHGKFEVISVVSSGGCPLNVGDSLPLQDSY